MKFDDIESLKFTNIFSHTTLCFQIGRNHANLNERHTPTIPPIRIKLTNIKIHFFLITFPLISLIKSINSQIKSKNTKPIMKAIKVILYIDDLSIFSKTELENTIPPVNAKTIAANIPKIVIYSFCISSCLSCTFLDNCFKSSMPDLTIPLMSLQILEHCFLDLLQVICFLLILTLFHLS